MQVDRNKAGWPFWRRWTVASFVGWFMGFLVGFVLASGFEPFLGVGPIQSTLGYLLLGACLGSGVGLMQWRVLRRRVAGIGSWILAGAVGMGVAGGTGYGTAVLVFGYSEGLEGLGSAAAVVGWTVVGAFGGAVTGILQWRVLRRYVCGAGWWVLASALGWALSFAANGTIDVVGIRAMSQIWPTYSAAWFLGGLIVGGVVLGSVTGGAIVWLLNERAHQA